jgi:hypothetical protein
MRSILMLAKAVLATATVMNNPTMTERANKIASPDATSCYRVQSKLQRVSDSLADFGLGIGTLTATAFVSSPCGAPLPLRIAQVSAPKLLPNQ